MHILLIAVLLTITACSRDEDAKPRQAGRNKKISYRSLSPQEQQEVEKLGQLALILTEMSTNERIVWEIYRGVHLYSGEEERVLFNDMLNASRWQARCSYSGFVANFEQVLDKERINAHFRTGFLFRHPVTSDAAVVRSFIHKKNLQIYWPYHEDWDGKETPTVSFHPLNNEDENIGYRKKTDANGQVYYETVLVNEDYAEKHPVWIVNYAKRLEPPAASPAAGQRSSSGIMMVYLGWAQCKKAFEGLFGGPTELVFGRVEGRAELNEDGNVKTSFLAHANVRVLFSRKETRRQTWKRVNSIWDSDWDKDKVSQHFFVYEHDDNGDEHKITGSVTVSAALPVGLPEQNNVQFNLAFTSTFKSKDDLIYAMTWKREAYLRYNTNGASGFGTREGFTVYSAGNEVFFTLPNYY